MNKAFEKILERFEEAKDIAQDDSVAELVSTRIWNKALHKAKQIVQEVAEEYNGGWIPCSERLPEEPFGCLVTVIDCEPVTQTDFENILPYFVGYDGESWNDEDGNEIPFEVIAWKPLPEPYKESED